MPLRFLSVGSVADLEGPIQLVLGDIEQRLVVIGPSYIASSLLHVKQHFISV